MLGLFRKKPAPPLRPSTAAGERVYAIGDIHGRLDLFERLLEMIDADDAARPPARTRIVLVGDLVDRGPDSRGVVDRALALTRERADVTVLMGNHEEILISAHRGEKAALALFDRVGGRDTLLSYGVDPADYDEADLSRMVELIDVIPAEHIDFLAGLGERAQSGDYLFVHAGVRPSVPLADQKPSDLRWIREPFLSSDAAHGAMIVHGHTITDAVDTRDNRIGIDTGAYASGRLTALGLEGEARWLLQT